MSKNLDETALLAQVTDVIEGYGKQVKFFEKDNTEHLIWASPPKESEETFGEGNALETLTEFIVANNSDLSFTYYRGQRIDIDAVRFRVERFQEIRSGINIVAVKFFVAR